MFPQLYSIFAARGVAVFVKVEDREPAKKYMPGHKYEKKIQQDFFLV
jgi:hypothetical protein